MVEMDYPVSLLLLGLNLGLIAWNCALCAQVSRLKRELSSRDCWRAREAASKYQRL